MNLSIHWHISEPNLTDHELDLLVMFMRTLSDEKFKPEVPKKVPSGLPLNHDSNTYNEKSIVTAGEK